MEFWGVEVKPGATVKCEPEEERYIHLSQASLGESKGKRNENVLISMNVDDKKLVLGTLSLEKCPQISCDLVFEKEFELSHNSKTASVYFCGYKTGSPEGDSEGDDYPESESEEENIPANLNANGTRKAKAVKGDGSAAKKAEPVKVVKLKSENGEEEDSDDDDDDDDADSEEDSEDDEDITKAMSDNDDDEDSSEDEDEATPKKVATGKRPAESALKTPAPKKKAKVVTPAGGQKTGDGKKVVHVATPHPCKKAVKTPANSDKSKQQTSPKSAGSVTCKPCNRNFNSESALQDHTKAKHG